PVHQAGCDYTHRTGTGRRESHPAWWTGRRARETLTRAPLAVAMLAATIVRTPFYGEQQDCATCYNGSGKVSSQHLLSAKPSPSLPFQSPESFPLFVFIRWPPERKLSMPFPPPRIRSFVPLSVLLFLHRKVPSCLPSL